VESTSDLFVERTDDLDDDGNSFDFPRHVILVVRLGLEIDLYRVTLAHSRQSDPIHGSILRKDLLRPFPGPSGCIELPRFVLHELILQQSGSQCREHRLDWIGIGHVDVVARE
jgi:hypothetical protein